LILHRKKLKVEDMSVIIKENDEVVLPMRRDCRDRPAYITVNYGEERVSMFSLRRMTRKTRMFSEDATLAM
jgi:hypothetical protein